MAVYEVEGMRGHRRELRSQARKLLGVSSDPVTSPDRLIRTADMVGQMLWLATGKRLRLAVIDCRTNEPITFHAAREMVR
jgi:hypothetical protein